MTKWRKAETCRCRGGRCLLLCRLCATHLRTSCLLLRCATLHSMAHTVERRSLPFNLGHWWGTSSPRQEDRNIGSLEAFVTWPLLHFRPNWKVSLKDIRHYTVNESECQRSDNLPFSCTVIWWFENELALDVRAVRATMATDKTSDTIIRGWRIK